MASLRGQSRPCRPREQQRGRRTPPPAHRARDDRPRRAGAPRPPRAPAGPSQSASGRPRALTRSTCRPRTDAKEPAKSPNSDAEEVRARAVQRSRRCAGEVAVRIWPDVGYARFASGRLSRSDMNCPGCCTHFAVRLRIFFTLSDSILSRQEPARRVAVDIHAPTRTLAPGPRGGSEETRCGNRKERRVEGARTPVRARASSTTWAGRAGHGHLPGRRSPGGGTVPSRGRASRRSPRRAI